MSSNKILKVIIEMILNLINIKIKITNKISIMTGNPNEAKAKNNVKLNKILNMKLSKVIFTIYFIYVN